MFLADDQVCVCVHACVCGVTPLGKNMALS